MIKLTITTPLNNASPAGSDTIVWRPSRRKHWINLHHLSPNCIISTRCPFFVRQVISRRARKSFVTPSRTLNLKNASKDDLYKISKDIEKEMKVAADLLEFEVAARLRDELKEIKKEIMELPS